MVAEIGIIAPLALVGGAGPQRLDTADASKRLSIGLLRTGCREHEVTGEGTMLIAEASVETERASRYLVQLCRHLNLRQGAPTDAGARRMVR